MNPFGISEASYLLIIQAFQRYPGITTVTVFGSRAKGTHHSGSDIDLAIAGPGASPEAALNLAAEINERLAVPYKVDIVDYVSITVPALREHIDRVGKPFF